MSRLYKLRAWKNIENPTHMNPRAVLYHVLLCAVCACATHSTTTYVATRDNAACGAEGLDYIETESECLRAAVALDASNATLDCSLPCKLQTTTRVDRPYGCSFSPAFIYGSSYTTNAPIFNTADGAVKGTTHATYLGICKYPISWVKVIDTEPPHTNITVRITVATVDACTEACIARPGCLSFTYRINNNLNCELSNSAAPELLQTNPNSDYYVNSRVKDAWTGVQGKQLDGHANAGVMQGSVKECKTACLARATCQSFNRIQGGCVFSDDAASSNGARDISTRSGTDYYVVARRFSAITWTRIRDKMFDQNEKYTTIIGTSSNKVTVETCKAACKARDSCQEKQGNPLWTDFGGNSCDDYVAKQYCKPDGTVGPGWNLAWGPLSNQSVPLLGAAVDATHTCCACGGGIHATDTDWTHDAPSTCLSFNFKKTTYGECSLSFRVAGRGGNMNSLQSAGDSDYYVNSRTHPSRISELECDSKKIQLDITTDNWPESLLGDVAGTWTSTREVVSAASECRCSSTSSAQTCIRQQFPKTGAYCEVPADVPSQCKLMGYGDSDSPTWLDGDITYSSIPCRDFPLFERMVGDTYCVLIWLPHGCTNFILALRTPGFVFACGNRLLKKEDVEAARTLGSPYNCGGDFAWTNNNGLMGASPGIYPDQDTQGFHPRIVGDYGGPPVQVRVRENDYNTGMTIPAEISLGNLACVSNPNEMQRVISPDPHFTTTTSTTITTTTTTSSTSTSMSRCLAGQHLNVTTNACVDCPNSTWSRGGNLTACIPHHRCDKEQEVQLAGGTPTTPTLCLLEPHNATCDEFMYEHDFVVHGNITYPTETNFSVNITHPALRNDDDTYVVRAIENLLRTNASVGALFHAAHSSTYDHWSTSFEISVCIESMPCSEKMGITTSLMSATSPYVCDMCPYYDGTNVNNTLCDDREAAGHLGECTYPRYVFTGTDYNTATCCLAPDMGHIVLNATKYSWFHGEAILDSSEVHQPHNMLCKDSTPKWNATTTVTTSTPTTTGTTSATSTPTTTPKATIPPIDESITPLEGNLMIVVVTMAALAYLGTVLVSCMDVHKAAQLKAEQLLKQTTENIYRPLPSAPEQDKKIVL